MSTKTALIAGATGLVGKNLLALLLASPRYGTVHSIGRRETGIEHPKLREWTVDFSTLDQYKDALRVDDIYCCLGTTMKKAGSRKAFKEVDYTYVVHLAKAGRNEGAAAFNLVSAMGADTGSLFFYNRVKGMTEDAVRSVGFDRLHIFRPSLLLGDRGEKRFGEEIAGEVLRAMQPLMIGALRKYRPIQAQTVAEAMHTASNLPDSGTAVYESDEIRDLAREEYV